MGLVLSCKWHGRITVDLYTALMLYLLVTFPLVMFELPMAIMIQSSYNYFYKCAITLYIISSTIE